MINTTFSWTQLQALARSCEAENNISGALDYYDAALVAFPTPHKNDAMAQAVLRRLERHRNQCRETLATRGLIGSGTYAVERASAR